MNVFYEGQVIWSQIDANMHMRHSAYSDFAAQARFVMLEEYGLKPDVFVKLKIGPVLFREELFYLREVHANDRIKVTSELTKARPDGSRFSLRQEMFRGDGVKAAIINVDGAWINLETRKLTGLPNELSELFMKMPRAADFVEDIPSEAIRQ
jgi:acyl-CoA thioester hydrolase